MRSIVLSALVALGGVAHAADEAKAPELPLDTFIKHPQFLDVKISPTGEYLAASVLVSEDTGQLAILRRSDLKVVGQARVRGKTFVNSFWWVNDERLVYTSAEKDGSLDNPHSTGELFATNFDGSKQDILAGTRKETGLNLQPKTDYAAALVDTLPDDDKFILVELFPNGNEEGTYPTLEKMNVYTGNHSLLARAPVLNAQFTTDNKQQVRFAEGNDIKGLTKLYYRADNDAKWELVNDQAESGLSEEALGFNADGTKAYLRSEEKDGPDSLYEWDPKTHEKTRVARNPNVDPRRLIYTHDGVQPFAVSFLDGRPKIALLDGTVTEAKILKALMGSFPGEAVSPTSWTKDGSELVFHVGSDRNPGAFYLLDKGHKVSLLLSSRQWIDPEQMAEMKPIDVTARDGLVLHGYLTLPKGSDGKNLPLIVHPHGGPHGPRDEWGFDPYVQLFANRGYAVLQVNFRGSGGYGRHFEEVGYRNWGGTMQDDLTDATLWAIKEGIADKDRICIYGASYGGYATAMGLVREPDLYKCGIGYVGVYDLATMYSNAGAYRNETGENVRKRYIGTDSKDLAERSPASHADKIKAPMLIIAGGEDKIAPIEHSKKMRDALQKAGKPYEWLVNEHESHGFFKEESNRELYTKMLEFLDKHIGAGSKKVARN